MGLPERQYLPLMEVDYHHIGLFPNEKPQHKVRRLMGFVNDGIYHIHMRNI